MHNSSNRYSRIFRGAAVVATLVIAAQCKAGQISAQIADAAGQPVVDAVVYANLVSGNAPVKPKRDASVEQINKEFVPLVSVVQTGTLVNFPNRDKVRHHVYSFSPAKTFEIKLYSGVPAKPILFDKPGEVVLGCNIHDTMIAYLLVVDTPIFAKTDKRGTAMLENLSAGEYEVHVWYPGTAVSSVPAPRKVKLSANESATLTFAFNLKPQSLAAPAPAPAPSTGK